MFPYLKEARPPARVTPVLDCSDRNRQQIGQHLWGKDRRISETKIFCKGSCHAINYID